MIENGIQDKINYIADAGMRANLENLVKEIIKTIDGRIPVKTRLNPCDFEWVYDNRIIIFFACHRNFYNFAISGNHSSIPKSPQCEWKDDHDGYIRLKRVKFLSASQKKGNSWLY
jgi:hypothetical protein